MAGVTESDLTEAQEHFARQFIESAIGHPSTRQQIPSDLLRKVYRTLARCEETKIAARDRWGNWDWPYAESQRQGRLYIPWLDEEILQFGQNILGLSSPSTDNRWPQGKRFALCLTHDVDIITKSPSWYMPPRAMRRALQTAGSIVERGALIAYATWRAIRSMVVSGDPLWCYERWLDVENQYGFKSTFFFFASHLRQPHVVDSMYSHSDTIRFEGQRMSVADMMRTIRARGWEIGVHGSFHSALVPGLLVDERQQVEDVSGGPVVSTRQHYLHYDVRVTPRLHAEAGITADSTQGFNRGIGFRAGTSLPYWCWDHDTDRTLPVLEVPQHIMDGGLFTANALAYDEALATRHCLELLDRVEAVGGCLTLSWHPNVILDEKWWKVYQNVLAVAAQRGAWGCSLGELAAWWKARQA